ncbi:MAG: sporulation peptidase YabG [Clostridia bacterium]|nr:sporulation peptidase YabG [Clostridia bacterium]
MVKIKTGDIVGRKSYGSDIFFCVKEIYEKDNGEFAFLKGLDVRLLADSPLHDLEKKDPTEILDYKHETIKKTSASLRNILVNSRMRREGLDLYRGDKRNPAFFAVPGRVLHLDGDEKYLEKCMRTYMQLEVQARGFFVPEEEQPDKIEEILSMHSADILVLTGHDGIYKGISDFSDINQYHSTKYFVEAVIKARKITPCKDSLVIFAGACQSHYEALLDAGANFASSPQRVLIHAYDPVFVVEKIAHTPFNETLSLTDVVGDTITGDDGIGGLETRGQFRWGYPKSPY